MFDNSGPLIWVSAAMICTWCLHSYLRLRLIPGPFFSAWTDISRALWVLTDKAHEKHIALHKRYGKIVRFGPNMVSVQDPAEIKHIYDFTGRFVKSDFYNVLLFYAKGRPVPTIFATQDEALHRALRHPISSIYSMSNLMTFEVHVDRTMAVFFEQLRTRYVTTGTICDLRQWFQWFAFDVMGDLTFSRRLGFLEHGEDIDGIANTIWRYFRRASPVSQITWLDWLWAKNPLLQRFSSVRANPVVAFPNARVKERQSRSFSSESSGRTHGGKDFLSLFSAAIEKDPSILDFALAAWTTSNVAAGSDTTAILLRTIFHNLLMDPMSMNQLMAELDNAVAEGFLSGSATWKEARSLPYLDAVVKEAGRLHPPFGLPFERVVPASGAVICDTYLPPDTVVGMSAWVVHHDKSVFDEDCHEWRPSRWLDCDKERRKAMESALMTFGAGNRACLGKNIAYLEIYKIVPSILRAFTVSISWRSFIRGRELIIYPIQFQLADPSGRDWKIENRRFVNQTGLNVIMKQREF